MASGLLFVRTKLARQIRRFAPFLGYCTLVFVLIGCGGSGGSTEGGGTQPSGGSTTVSSISLTPSAATIQAGQTQQFVAVAMDPNGNVVPNVTVTWTVSNPAVANVTGSGLAVGAAAGATLIGATIGPVNTATTLVVTPSPVTSITVTPPAASIQAGQTQQFVAVAADANGNVVPNVTVTWTSNNQAVANVSSGGLATGVSAGAAIIGATIGPVNTGATVTVTPSPVTSITVTPSAASIQAGQTQQFTATARDANGNVVPNATFTWTSNNQAVASITANGGLATGLLVGATTITATIGSVSSTASTLTVTAVPPSPPPPQPTVTSITVTPPASSIQVGQTQQFTAVARDANGNVVPNVTVTWTSNTTPVASINSNGLATGVSAGATIIAAAIGGVSSGVPLTVAPLPVTSITVTPPASSIQVGQTQQFTATARDANGNVVPNVTVTWNSSSSGVASIINTTGLATGQSGGTTTITASAGGVTSPGAQLTVTTGGGGGRSYSTNFPLTENPLSEGGNWINGLQTGLDWLDIRTTPGFAFGTRVGGAGGSYTDPTAVLSGTWGQNQTVEVTTVVNSGGCCKEIELRLNSTMMAHSSTGYEILFEVAGTISTVRWDGAIGNFTFLAGAQNLSRALQTGDVLKATRVGNVITVYFNGVPVQQVTDATYLGGSPGIGLNNYAPATTPSDFGISSFTASD